MVDKALHTAPTSIELLDGIHTIVDVCHVCSNVHSVDTRGFGNVCPDCGTKYPVDGPEIRKLAIWKKPALGIGRGNWEYVEGLL